MHSQRGERIGSAGDQVAGVEGGENAFGMLGEIAAITDEAAPAPLPLNPFAPGDQLRITSNFRSNGDRFINNELVKVLSLDEQKMVVRRGNGKEAVISRRDLVHVDQGVTVTSYSSQSKGPDQMLCSAPVRTGIKCPIAVPQTEESNLLETAR